MAVGLSPSGRYSGPTLREGVFSRVLAGERGMIVPLWVADEYTRPKFVLIMGLCA